MSTKPEQINFLYLTQHTRTFSLLSSESPDRLPGVRPSQSRWVYLWDGPLVLGKLVWAADQRTSVPLETMVLQLTLMKFSPAEDLMHQRAKALVVLCILNRNLPLMWSRETFISLWCCYSFNTSTGWWTFLWTFNERWRNYLAKTNSRGAHLCTDMDVFMFVDVSGVMKYVC